MKKIFTLIIFQLLISNIFCQDFDGCVFIDFEELPDQMPEDNLVLSTQYFNDYGVTFILEDGTAPLLAKVGSPVSAFGSAFGDGNDTPAPGQNIGNFFITDDGLLTGLTSPDLLVNFTIPIDSFSASVLDIDFGEVFTIESRDLFGNIIQSITITDGDPNTGDGMATPFGFNSNECDPPIYSIRFHGTRVMPGAFGLGMDNFSFCTTDPDIRTLVFIETVAPTCNNPTGSIILDNQSGDSYTYSLDHGPFQSSSIMHNISPGFHNLTFRDAFGCESTIPVVIDEYVPLVISDLSVTHTSCEEDNGAIVVFTSSEQPLQYSIDGINYQASNIFTDIPPGDYTVRILDQDNCYDEMPFSINTSSSPSIEAVVIKDDYCNDSRGSINITAQGGTGTLQYAINDQASGLDPLIPNLPPGEYTINVTDEAGCKTSTQNTISEGNPLLLDQLSFQGPDCDQVNGFISFQASGGSGVINYWLNDSIAHPAGSFVTLPGGVYQLSAIDENGCHLDTLAALPIPQCPIYIPNGFSPNDDGINDNFQIFTNTFYDVEVLQFMIFNRWGGLVWNQKDFTINSYREWWDGTIKNKPAQQGVYVYMIQVRHKTGFEEVLSGDVTLVR